MTVNDCVAAVLKFIYNENFTVFTSKIRQHFFNKKHLKNVGPICHNEPPHAHSPDVASGTVARLLRIDVHNNNDNA